MKVIHILLVEDNEGDVLLTKEAFAERGNTYKISIAKDGVEAIDLLSNAQDSALPDLVLLDINLPRKNGHDVLKFIKQSEKLKQIPVIMLTTSSSETDINLAYKNHANCFLTKPDEMESFLDLISQLEIFWFSMAKLPS